MSDSGLFTGWQPTEAEIEEFRSLPHGLPFTAGDIPEAPQLLKDHPPSTWLKYESQGRFGSCVGNAAAACSEILYWLHSGGDVVQLSRWMGYIEAQNKSGPQFTSDRGAFIQGGVDAMIETGICLESTLPYPSKYHRNIPEEAYEEAKKYRAVNRTPIRNYDELKLFMEAYIGPVIIGRRWGRGHHALAIIEMLPDGGVREFNSHKGNEIIDNSKDKYRRVLEARDTIAFGVTEMPEVMPRKWDYLDPEQGGMM